MPLPIRPATDADVADVHALIERAYRGDTARAGWTHEADLLSGPRTDEAALIKLIADPAQSILVAVDAGTLAACVAVADRGNGVGYLGQLAVDPSRQADGLGRAMIAAAEDFARGFKARIMEMTVIGRRQELIAYYQRRGYRLTGEVRPFSYEQPISGAPLLLHVMVRELSRA